MRSKNSEANSSVGGGPHRSPPLNPPLVQYGMLYKGFITLLLKSKN